MLTHKVISLVHVVQQIRFVRPVGIRVVYVRACVCVCVTGVCMCVCVCMCGLPAQHATLCRFHARPYLMKYSISCRIAPYYDAVVRRKSYSAHSVHGVNDPVHVRLP